MGLNIETREIRPTGFSSDLYESSVSGPWYGDSNFCGRGMTEEESVARAVAEVLSLRRNIDEFITSLPEETAVAAERYFAGVVRECRYRGCSRIGLNDEDKARLLSMPDSVIEIIEASLELEENYYSRGSPLGLLFYKLRKSLEGVWGHDLPDMRCED